MILLDTETPQPGAILAMGEKEMSLMHGGLSTKITYEEMRVIESTDPEFILRQLKGKKDSVVVIRSSEGRSMFMLLPDGAVIFQGATFTDLPTDDLIVGMADRICASRQVQRSFTDGWKTASSTTPCLLFKSPQTDSGLGHAYYLFTDLEVPYSNPVVLGKDTTIMIYLPPIIAGGSYMLNNDRMSHFFLAATQPMSNVLEMPLNWIGLSNTYMNGTVCFGTSKTEGIEMQEVVNGDPELIVLRKVQTSLMQFLGGNGNGDLLDKWMSRPASRMRQSILDMYPNTISSPHSLYRKYLETLSSPGGWRKVEYVPLDGVTKLKDLKNERINV